MKIKVGASFSGKISTGSFENMNPGFYAEYEIESNGKPEDEIKAAQTKLHEVLYKQFQEVAHKATVERIEKEFKDIRLYDAPNGRKFPSVTSILSVEGVDWPCSMEELFQYEAQGNITHARVAHYIQTGKWAEPKDLEECWPYLYTLKKGSLQLDPDCADFPAFLEKYPIKDMKIGSPVFCEEHEYAGTPDFIGVPDFKDSEPIPTLFDVKRTVIKIKNLSQTAAYAHPLGIGQLGIIPLNDDTKQKFSKPIISKDVKGYMGMFLDKRKKFRQRYSI